MQIRAIIVTRYGTPSAHGGSMVRTLATALVTLAACAQTPDPAGGSGGDGKADGTQTRLTFSEDFSEMADGPLVAGATVKLSYDLDRITDCRGETNGSEVWGTTAFAAFDGGAPKELALSRLQSGRVVPVEAMLAIPSTATSVELWFTNTNRWGCVAYDSNDSANYGFEILPRSGGGSVLAFDADGSESQSGAIHDGDDVVIHYAPERLAQCAGSTGGHAAWGITGYWQVDDGTVHQVMVARAQGSLLVAADPSITVPRGHALAVWFEATSVWGCHAYDSDYGANYTFAIE
jgi:uncharacterized protein YraI